MSGPSNISKEFSQPFPQYHKLKYLQYQPAPPSFDRDLDLTADNILENFNSDEPHPLALESGYGVAPSGVFYPPHDNHFPASFNPRKAPNMGATEKVSKWILQVPYHCNELDEIRSDCFPGVTDYASTASDGNGDGDGIIDFTEVDAIIDFQARKVTRYITRANYDESEHNHESSHDDEEGNFYDSEGNIVLDECGMDSIEYSSRKKSEYLLNALF